METYLKNLVPVLGLVLALLLFLRRRRSAVRESGERDLVEKSVYVFERAHRIWGSVVALLAVGVVIYLVFTEELIANILLTTLAVMAAIVLFARRNNRVDPHLGGGA